MQMDKFPPPTTVNVSRQRADGWTPEVQQDFIVALIEHGSIRVAARTVDRAVTSAYRLRAREPAFAKAWDAARTMAYSRLRDEALERALDGTPQEVWHNGEWVGMKRVRSDRLLMSLLNHLKYESPPNAMRQRSVDEVEAERSANIGVQLGGLDPAPPAPVTLRPRKLVVRAAGPEAAGSTLCT